MKRLAFLLLCHLYSPPDKFVFYKESKGESLWLVPRKGEPVLWVLSGRGFVYVP